MEEWRGAFGMRCALYQATPQVMSWVAAGRERERREGERERRRERDGEREREKERETERMI